MSLRKHSQTIALGAMILCTLALMPTTSQADTLFGARESDLSSNMAPFPKWTGVMRSQSTALERMKEECSSTNCRWSAWQAMIESARGQSLEKQLKIVNQGVNQTKYVEDSIRGTSDLWSNAFDFYLNEGDCEDFAISKYYALKELGVNPADMRIVILQDSNLNLMHAVLAVSVGNKSYILDNQINQVISDNSIRHYRPVYSINEQGWRRYTPHS